MTNLLLALLLAAPDPSVSCVRVECPTAIGKSCGSGTVVACEGGMSLILTARHVCNDSFETPITVVTPTGTHPAKLAAYDTLTDLALVRVEAELPAVAVATKAPKPGDSLRQWGCTGGGKRQAKVGVAEAWDGSMAGGGAVFGATIPANSGDSGCGVFDASGALVAVTVRKAHITDGPAPARCVHLCDVRRVLGTVAKRDGRFPKLLAAMESAKVAGPTVPVPVVPPFLPLPIGST